MKTLPFIGSVSAAGVGGIGIVAWQATSGGEASPLTPQLATDIQKPKEKLWKETDFSKFDKQLLDSDLSSFKNDTFKLPGSAGCFSNFFPKISVPDYHDSIYFTGKVDVVHKTQNKEQLKIKDPKEQGTEDAKACVMMALEHVDLYALFKSELVIKNDKVGLALWTGVKTSNDSEEWHNHIQLRITHYFMFLEKEEDEWKVRGGYSWWDQFSNNRIKTLSVTFKSPDGSINKTFSKQEHTYKGKGAQYYSGAWKQSSDNKGSSLLQLKGDFYSGGSYQTTMNKLDISMPLPVAGYTETGVFYEKKSADSEDMEWKRYCQKDQECKGPQKITKNLDLDVSSSIEAWYKPFNGKKGNWERADSSE